MPDYYTVKPGDSPASIAGAVYGDQRMFAELMAANGGAPLRPGMQIVLPKQVSNPFVSNELAARMGMATSGQIADAYKAGDLTASGKMNWTATQGLSNQTWAYQNMTGVAPNLVNGRMPSGYGVAGVAPGVAPTVAPKVAPGAKTPAASRIPVTGIGSSDLRIGVGLGVGVSSKKRRTMTSGSTFALKNFTKSASAVSGAALSSGGYGIGIGVAGSPFGRNMDILKANQMLPGNQGLDKLKVQLKSLGNLGAPGSPTGKLPAGGIGSPYSIETGGQQSVMRGIEQIARGISSLQPTSMTPTINQTLSDVAILSKQLSNGTVPEQITADQLEGIGRGIGMNEKASIEWAQKSGYVFDAKTGIWNYSPERADIGAKINKLPPITEGAGETATVDGNWADVIANNVRWGGMYGLYDNEAKVGGYTYSDSVSSTGRSSALNSISNGVLNLKLSTG